MSVEIIRETHNYSRKIYNDLIPLINNIFFLFLDH